VRSLSFRAMALAIGLVLAGALAVPACSGDDNEAVPAPEPGQSSPALPSVEQADWKMKVFPTAATHKITRKEKKRFHSQGPRLRRLVRDVYAALFLDPAIRARTVRARFAPPAAQAMLKTKSGMPNGADRIKTLIRRARIGVQVGAAKRAVATVHVTARATVKGERVRVVHRSTLWLQRSGRGWRAIAFDIDQEPVR
jgi:hypothetical protein